LDLDPETRKPSDLSRVERELSLREQGEESLDKICHRDIDIWDIEILEVEEVEILQVLK
jgi:hypothetical protein